MEEVIGQAVLFFLVGMDTTATSIAFLIYNLAVHPEIQEKLYDEIMNVAGDKVNKIKPFVAANESRRKEKSLTMGNVLLLKKCKWPYKYRNFSKIIQIYLGDEVVKHCLDFECASVLGFQLIVFNYAFIFHMQEIDYNLLCQMNLLDMCVQESLRMFPPAVR